MTTATVNLAQIFDVTTGARLPVTVRFAPFRHTICKRKNGKITRERFVFDWREEQREQGITRRPEGAW